VIGQVLCLCEVSSAYVKGIHMRCIEVAWVQSTTDIVQWQSTIMVASHWGIISATAVYIHKQRNALRAWAKCFGDQYVIIPKFGHTDKDMAKIGVLGISSCSSVSGT
jgi:hypothetical protein